MAANAAIYIAVPVGAGAMLIAPINPAIAIAVAIAGGIIYLVCWIALLILEPIQKRRQREADAEWERTHEWDPMIGRFRKRRF